MSEKEVKNCPKCGGEMEEGERITSFGRGWFPQAVKFAKKMDIYGDKIVPFYCKNCGYVELYKEMKEKRE